MKQILISLQEIFFFFFVLKEYLKSVRDEMFVELKENCDSSEKKLVEADNCRNPRILWDSMHWQTAFSYGVQNNMLKQITLLFLPSIILKLKDTEQKKSNEFGQNLHMNLSNQCTHIPKTQVQRRYLSQLALQFF